MTTTRFTTQQNRQGKFIVLRNGEVYGTTEFGNHNDAETYAALREIREVASKMNISIDMEDSALLKRLHRIVG